MNLIDLIASLEELDDELTIYAEKPWSASSLAIAATEPPDGSLPTDAKRGELHYFLEVSIAREFIEDWETNLAATPSARQRCARLIRYAENDA